MHSLLVVTLLWYERTPLALLTEQTGPPEAVHNCSVRNATANLLLVSCRAGDSGGLRPSFILEVYNEKQQLYANYSTSDPSRSLSLPPSSLSSSSTSATSSSSSPSSPSSPASSHGDDGGGSGSAAAASSSASSSYTDADGPNFIIPSLPLDSKFTLHIYARNSRGRSPPTLVSAPSFTQSEKQTGKEPRKRCDLRRRADWAV